VFHFGMDIFPFDLMCRKYEALYLVTEKLCCFYYGITSFVTSVAYRQG